MSRRTVLRSAAALALTVVLVLALALPALAAGSGSITIKPNGQEGLGGADRFTAYQIFEGTVGKDPNELDNLVWGDGVDHQELVDDMKRSTLSLGSQTFGSVFTTAWNEWDTKHRGERNEAEFVAQWLADQTKSNALYADDFARLVAEHTQGDGTISTRSGVNWVISSLDDGYYLVKDNYVSESVSGKSDGSVSSYILHVAGDEQVEVTLKATIPTVVKKVEGKDGYLTGIDDQEINFTLTGTVAENIAEYSTYKYEFVDTLSPGLTMDVISDGNLNVKLGEHQFAQRTDYTTKYEAKSDGSHVLTITFSDLIAVCKKSSVTLDKNSTIVVNYTARLTKDAVVTGAGNPNTVTLKYSNDPYGSGEGETAPDEVKTYTIALNIEKKGPDKITPLENVGFKLMKNSQYATMEKGTGDYWSITGWDATGTELVTDAAGKFSIHGLDAGKYTLEETTTPEGYETMKDIVFDISATVDDSTGALSNVELKRDANTLSRQDVSLSGNMNDGSGTLTLTNYKSPILPHTGGIGAKIVYLVSTLAVLTGAAIVTVAVRKRGRGRHEQTR